MGGNTAMLMFRDENEVDIPINQIHQAMHNGFRFQRLFVVLIHPAIYKGGYGRSNGYMIKLVRSRIHHEQLSKLLEEGWIIKE